MEFFLNYILDHSLLLLSRFSVVRLCATPYTEAHQAPPSLGFSRQEHWSGLPFSCPKRESEVTQSCPTLSDPVTAAYQALPSMGFSRREYWSGVPLPSPDHSLQVYKYIVDFYILILYPSTFLNIFIY